MIYKVEFIVIIDVFVDSIIKVSLQSSVIHE